MKDITQSVVLGDEYGWNKNLTSNASSNSDLGGFDFSKVDAYPPKMYFGRGKRLIYVNYPSNGTGIVIKSRYATEPVHLDVRNEGAQDVIYFCTSKAYYRYNFQTGVEEKLLTFDLEDWNIIISGEINACTYLRAVNRIILISRDKVGVWGLVSGAWTKLFTPKKRFWYPYKVRVLELGTIGHFILYARHAFMVIDSANLDAVHVWNREWDWGDWGTWNYALQMGYGIARFDVENLYPQTFKEVKDVYRINSWDDNSSSPIVMVKDTGELGTYIFSSGTFTSLSTASHFWNACFTTSNQKVMAVSWLPDANKEFITFPNNWANNDHTKDWHLWLFDWSSGSVVSSSKGWDPRDGGAKAITFFVQGGNPYLLIATQNTAHIRRYDETDMSYDPTQVVSEPMSTKMQGIWAVDKIENSNVIIFRNNKEIRGGDFDDVNFSMTMRQDALEAGGACISYAVHPVANALLFFSNNKLSRRPIPTGVCMKGVPVKFYDKDIGAFGICK
jgi:hypothetical protein